MRLASDVETKVEVSVSPETPCIIAQQRRQPAQRPQIDVGKISKAAAAKNLVANLSFSCPSVNGDSSRFDLYILILNVAILVTSVDG